MADPKWCHLYYQTSMWYYKVVVSLDLLFKKLKKKYHPKIKLTIEVIPWKFLSFGVINWNNEVITSAYWKKEQQQKFYWFLGNLKFLSNANVTLY